MLPEKNEEYGTVDYWSVYTISRGAALDSVCAGTNVTESKAFHTRLRSQFKLFPPDQPFSVGRLMERRSIGSNPTQM